MQNIFFGLLTGLILLSTLSLQAQDTQPGHTTDRSIAGSWTTLTYQGKPHARHENAFVEANGKFYLLGGRGRLQLDIYDPETGIWTQGADIPFEMHHFQAVSYQGDVYVLGAMQGGYPAEQPLSHIMIYQTASDRWIQGPEIPEDRRRAASGVVVVDDKVYMLCGITQGHNTGHVAWVDRYDLKTGSWQVLAEAPRPRDHFQAAFHEGKIYCAGGRNTSALTGQSFELTIAEVDVYDVQSNTWTSLPQAAHLPTQRAGSSTVVWGEHLIVMGGESGAQLAAHSEVEAFDFKRQAWKKLPDLNRGRHGTQAIVFDGKIYTMAGCGNRGGSPELDLLEVFQVNSAR